MNVIRIGNTIINLDHVVAIELEAEVYDSANKVYETGVRITMDVISGEFAVGGEGGCYPLALTWTGEAADVLRPWLLTQFPSLQSSKHNIDLPTEDEWVDKSK